MCNYTITIIVIILYQQCGILCEYDMQNEKDSFYHSIEFEQNWDFGLVF